MRIADFQIGPVGDLVGHDAELGADRIGHLAPHHGDGDRHRMAGAQAAHDDVERVGELRGEPLLPPRCAGSAAPNRADRRARTARPRRLRSTLPRHTMRHAERDHGDNADDDDKAAEPDGEARLQDQPVERDDISR